MSEGSGIRWRRGHSPGRHREEAGSDRGRKVRRGRSASRFAHHPASAGPSKGLMPRSHVHERCACRAFRAWGRSALGSSWVFDGPDRWTSSTGRPCHVDDCHFLPQRRCCWIQTPLSNAGDARRRPGIVVVYVRSRRIRMERASSDAPTSRRRRSPTASAFLRVSPGVDGVDRGRLGFVADRRTVLCAVE